MYHQDSQDCTTVNTIYGLDRAKVYFEFSKRQVWPSPETAVAFEQVSHLGYFSLEAQNLLDNCCNRMEAKEVPLSKALRRWEHAALLLMGLWSALVKLSKLERDKKTSNTHTRNFNDTPTVPCFFPKMCFLFAIVMWVSLASLSCIQILLVPMLSLIL